jgi:hypothetical protein
VTDGRVACPRVREHATRPKQALAEDPEDAPYAEFDFGRYESAKLNGMDRDARRRQPHSK